MTLHEQVLGRRHAYNLAVFIFLMFAIGAAVSKNFPTFVAMRTLAGFEASFFMVAGQAMIADIFAPVSSAIRPFILWIT